MQIGADVFCDSQVMLAELEHRWPSAGAKGGLPWAVNLWADRLFFQTTVPIIFGELGDKVPRAFIEDREKLSGRPFDVAAMKAASAPMRGQWRGHAAWIESALKDSGGPFLRGAAPGLADAAAYMNIWFLAGGRSRGLRRADGRDGRRGGVARGPHRDRARTAQRDDRRGSAGDRANVDTGDPLGS